VEPESSRAQTQASAAFGAATTPAFGQPAAASGGFGFGTPASTPAFGLAQSGGAFGAAATPAFGVTQVSATSFVTLLL